MGENSPAVIAVTSEIERLRPAILENVRNQRNSMVASRSNLAQTNGMYNSMLRTIPVKERELLEISRQQTIKNNVYSFLLQKREETALSSSSALADSKVVDKATVSFNPVSPKSIIAYLAAVMLAFIIGIAVVVAKELLTGKILFRQDIEKYTQIPIVAEIVSLKGKGGVVVNQPDKIYISEQFRHLRAAMGLYGRVVTRKKILVTSSIPGEGKSFVAANLAMSLALSGKKVVLVDADIRGPKTSSTFNLYGETGLANYLQSEAQLEQIIYPGQHENLSVMPAGFCESNPTEVLLNGQLPEMFGKLERMFDYVIVDTSPVDPVTDAYVLSEFCDRTLFIVRHGHTPKAMMQLLDDNNKIKALKNLAIVFNGVKKRGFLKGSYGYGYGFGYEYVYKNKDTKQKGAVKPSMN
jgi:capsular exopolysaccharide synthesis family protein